MISEIMLPIWLSCIKNNRGVELEEVSDTELKVADCQSKFKCYGCNPTGVVIKKYILDLEEIDRISTMDRRSTEKTKGEVAPFFTDKGVLELLKKYEQSETQYYFEHRVRCDLDTIIIYKNKENT